MPAFSVNLGIAVDSIRSRKLRAALTILGLTMGVAALITVMTIVQGTNLYVEQKVANLGVNVFQIARTPFAVLDFSAIVKALRNKNITLEDMKAVAQNCRHCQQVGTQISATMNLHYKEKELQDSSIQGQTPNMSEIDTRTLATGRYFSESEDQHAAAVCVIGDKLATEFFAGISPIGKTIRAANTEFTV